MKTTLLVLCIAVFVMVATDAKPAKGKGDAPKWEVGKSSAVGGAAGVDPESESYTGGKNGETFGLAHASAKKGAVLSASNSQSFSNN